jgi:hypothetical protein
MRIRYLSAKQAKDLCGRPFIDKEISIHDIHADAARVVHTYIRQCNAPLAALCLPRSLLPLFSSLRRR